MKAKFQPLQPIQEMEDYKLVTAEPEEGSGSENQDPDEDPPVSESLLEVTVLKPQDPTRFVTGYVIVASLLAALGGVLFGYDVGIVSGALLQLNRDFSLTCIQQEMVVSAMLLGALIASLTGGFLVDCFGRRRSIIANSSIFIVGAIVLTCAQNFSTLIVGRLILGFGVSLSAIAECVYITEISPANQRGLLVSLNELGITSGFLLAYLINLAFINTPSGWRYMFGLSMVPAFLQGIGMILLPPSPRFLMIRQQEHEARRTLVKLRGTEDVDDEVQAIRTSLNSQKLGSTADLFRMKENMCFRFLMGIGLVLFQQFTGQPSVLYYAPTILLSIGFGSDTAAMVATVGIGVVKVVFTTVSLLCVDCAGRRKFLISGTLMMLIGITCLALSISQKPDVMPDDCQIHKFIDLDRQLLANNSKHFTKHSGERGILDKKKRNHTLMYPFHIQTRNHSIGSTPQTYDPRLKWLSFIALVLYISGYAIGFGPVVWLVLSEIFPSQIRGRAISMTTVANWGTNLVVSFTFLDLMKALSVSGTFLLFAAMSGLSLIYICLLVPETKGKSLEQISEQLNQSYLGLKCCCKKDQVGSRLHLEDDSDTENDYSFASESTGYSLLARE